MASLAKLATKLETRKADTANMRRKNQRELKKTKTTLRRSSSGLRATERGIRGAHNVLSDVSESLSQSIERQNSVLRLIEDAKIRLEREKAARDDAQRELDAATTDDQRKSFTWRLNSTNDTIAQIESEMRARKKMIKKTLVAITDYGTKKTKLSTTIRKKRQSMPELTKLVKSGRKRTETLARKISSEVRQEDSAKRNLVKIRTRLAEISATKRRASALKAAKKRKRVVKKKTAKKRKPATRRKAAKKVTRKKSTAKRRVAKKATRKRPTTRRKAAKKVTRKKPTAKRRVAKKATRKRPAAKRKSVTRRKPARRTTSKKTSRSRTKKSSARKRVVRRTPQRKTRRRR